MREREAEDLGLNVGIPTFRWWDAEKAVKKVRGNYGLYWFHKSQGKKFYG